MLSGLSGNWVFALEEDREGNIWVGTNGGLTRFSPRIIDTISDLGPVHAIDATPDGSVWVQASEELVRIRAAAGTATGLARNAVRLTGGAPKALHKK